MKRFIALFLTVLCATIAYAQQGAAPAAGGQAAGGQQATTPTPQEPDIGGVNASNVGATPQESLKEVSVDKFEIEGAWKATISPDSGYAFCRLFSGGPSAKQPIPDESNIQGSGSDTKVFGGKIDFLRRGYCSVFITAARTIPIEGITKTVSVWIAGRNYNHTLNLILQDARGKYFELYMGKLNFQGWKKLTVPIPPQDGDANGIVQNNYHYSSNMGINIVGFRIDIAPMEAYGSYYFYLDDLRATTDLFAEQNRDVDDPRDDW